MSVYLDYAATTPLRPEARAALLECIDTSGDFANAASTHAAGRRVAARVASDRAVLAQAVGARAEDLVFTSGATEANNLALLGGAEYYQSRGRHIVTVKTEHKAVVDPCKRLETLGWKVTYLLPDANGHVPVDAVRDALREDTVLVSVMLVNNEIGCIQDLRSIAEVAHEHGALVHTDAAQALGKIPVDLGALDVDLASLSAHKCGGPKGIGALYVRRRPRVRVQPLLFGGGHEHGMRSGTLATHQIAAFAAAARTAAAGVDEENVRVRALRESLWSRLEQGVTGLLRNSPVSGVAQILNVSFPGVDGEALRAELDGRVDVSSGSACTSGGGESSYVLRALGRDDALAHASLRFSFGRETCNDDIEAAAACVIDGVRRLRSLAP